MLVVSIQKPDKDAAVAIGVAGAQGGLNAGDAVVSYALFDYLQGAVWSLSHE